MSGIGPSSQASAPSRQPRRIFRWLAVIALLAIAILFAVGEVLVRRAGPILKGRVIETLSTRFNGRVELDTFDVSQDAVILAKPESQ